MTSSNSRINVRLEIELPQHPDGAICAKGLTLRDSPSVVDGNIAFPASSGNASAKPANPGPGYVICAYGTVTSGAKHVFAKVYDSQPTSTQVPDGTDWVRPNSDNSWQFNALSVGAVNTGATPKFLQVWVDDGTTELALSTRSFNAVPSIRTDCDPKPQSDGLTCATAWELPDDRFGSTTTLKNSSPIVMSGTLPSWWFKWTLFSGNSADFFAYDSFNNPTGSFVVYDACGNSPLFSTAGGFGYGPVATNKTLLIRFTNGGGNWARFFCVDQNS